MKFKHEFLSEKRIWILRYIKEVYSIQFSVFNQASLAASLTYTSELNKPHQAKTTS